MSVGLSGMVLAGVLTATIHLGKTSVRIAAYAEMDTQVRRAFAQLAADMKAATYVTLNGASDITVSVANSNGTTGTYTYAWDSTGRNFYRVPGSSSSSQSGRINLITGIPAASGGGAGLSFTRLDISGNTASTNNATKSIKVVLTVSRSSSGTVIASSSVSATFLLRNKPVS
jgi:hypothetical protein